MSRFGANAHRSHDEFQSSPDFRRNKFEVVGESELTKEEEEVYAAALLADAQRPKIQEFIDFEDEPGFYTEQRVATDQAKLDRFNRAREESPKTKRGLILEYIINRHCEASNWLGENCLVCDTTLYDDEKNKTDLVLEFIKKRKNGDLVLYRLAVDVTSTQNDRNYMSKHDRIVEGLDNGVMARLKYFTSEAKRKKVGFIKNVPKAVLALGPKSIQRLARDFKYSQDLYKAAREDNDPVRAKRLRSQAMAVMEKNPVQLALLEQIHRQMQDQMIYVLGNILRELDRDFKNFSTGNEEESRFVLSELADVYSRLQGDWAINVSEMQDYADRVIDTFYRSKNLLNRLKGKGGDDGAETYSNSLIAQHTATLDRLRPILNISRELLDDKRELLGQRVVDETYSRMGNNVVIENSVNCLGSLSLPKRLGDKLPKPMAEI